MNRIIVTFQTFYLIGSIPSVIGGNRMLFVNNIYPGDSLQAWNPAQNICICLRHARAERKVVKFLTWIFIATYNAACPMILLRVDNLQIRLTSEILLKFLLNALGSYIEQNYCNISNILFNMLYPFCYWWKSDAVCE